jgi:hypothetical protein
VRAEPDVAVRVDQSGHDPASVEDRVRTIDRFGGQRAVDNPPLHRLLVGEPKATHMKSGVAHPYF